MPQHKRGPWSQSEDQFLLHLVNLHGAHNWVRISATIQTRSPKQCRERFHQNLKPNLNHDPITPEEGAMIEQMVADMGKRWAEIARRLRGRSDNAVKNWWNGGMNRRRRSNAPRGAEMEVRKQPQLMAGPAGMTQPPTHHHSLPSDYVALRPMQHQYFGKPIYHRQVPQHIHVPSNGPMYLQSGLIETPLPSPSAFSQLSADGTPSLVSDCSSLSGWSPHNGPSPIELPPLVGSHVDRRQSQVSSLRLSNPGTLIESEYFSSQHMGPKQTPNLPQDPFQPHQQHQQYFPQLGHYLPSQPHPMRSQPLSQYNMQPNPLLRGNYPPQPIQPKPLQAPFQLPSIQNLAVSDSRSKSSSVPIDPALTGPHKPAMQSAPMPEGSPLDKMSLSNLTH